MNVDTIKQEIELDKMDDTNGEKNPYCKIITCNAEKDNTVISQMEQWTILSNVVNYVKVQNVWLWMSPCLDCN